VSSLGHLDNSHMDKQELVEHEIVELDKLSKEYVFKLEEVLSSIRKVKVKLWLVQKDKYRLLTLRAWETKYKIDLKTILQILLPFWEAFVQRRSRKMKKAGLNVRVSTLVGKKSEQILKDQINKLYPSSEHKTLWMMNERENIVQNYLKRLEKKSDDGVRSRSDPSGMYSPDGRPKTLIDFNSPDAFMKYYRKYMKKESLAREEIEMIMKKYAYRNNPFRPELL
jgi:hypothetical protein